MNPPVPGFFCSLFLAAPAVVGQIQAPPPAVVDERPATEAPMAPRRLSPAAGETLYAVGDPTDEEQAYLEYINYGRADPAGEAHRLATSDDPHVLSAYQQYGVDLNKFIADTSAYPAAPPLAFEPRLIAAARGHSQWMRTTGVQSHVQPNPPRTTSERITAAGYPWQRNGESIFAYAENPWFGHAGFEVDWGLGPGGMQDPPGHRNNNHDAKFREIGVGVVMGEGPNDTGPQYVTIKFASRANLAPLVTGVAFLDLNANQRFDLGEGLENITVNVSDSEYAAVTTASGAYAVPTENGARVISFSGPHLSVPSVNRAVANGDNVKVDLVLPYVGPSVAGPAHVPVGVAAAYSFTPVPGITQYRLRSIRVSATPPAFDASNGLTGLLTTLAGTPTPLVSRSGGGQAYHLTHAAGLTDEILELDLSLRPSATGSLRFLSRLGYASTDQEASVQVSSDGGLTWTSIWTQVGSNAAGDTNYQQRNVSLAAFAGQRLRIRFVYGFGGCSTCSLFDQTENGVGFHFDNVEFTATEVLYRDEPTLLPAGTTFAFAPPNAGKFELEVQPVKARGSLPFGPPFALDTDAVALPSATISAIVVEPNGRMRVDFSTTGTAAGPPKLQRAGALGQAFAPVTATLRTNSPANYSFQYEPTGESGFLRVALP